MTDGALLVLRVVVGLYVFAHGAQKLFGWFGGAGLAGNRQLMERLRFRPAGAWAWISGLAEAGGLLLALGLLTPVGVMGVAAAMVTAIFTAHLGKGWFSTKGGPELALTNLTVAVAIGLAGAGRWSLDAALGIRYPQPLTLAVALLLALIGVGVAFATRRPPAPA